MSVEAIKKVRRVLQIFSTSETAVRPHCIVVGPSGSGKSHTLQALCEEMDMPMFEINAAALTKEGTSGNSLSKALSPLLQSAGRPTVCFVDEFDKLFISGNSNSALAHESTNGVQNEFLKVIEGHASVFGDYGKYVDIKTDHVLFVFAGAFNGEENIDLDRLREMGLKTEFLGRVGLVFGLEKVSLDQMKNILENSPLLQNYLQLFPEVKKTDVTQPITKVLEENYEKNTIGVRLINTLIHQFFINGGLTKKAAKQVTFQKTLTLN